MSWPLLNGGGIMIFVDYEWTVAPVEIERPKAGIDAFLAAQVGQFRELHRKHQVIVEKISDRANERRSALAHQRKRVEALADRRSRIERLAVKGRPRRVAGEAARSWLDLASNSKAPKLAILAVDADVSPAFSWCSGRGFSKRGPHQKAKVGLRPGQPEEALAFDTFYSSDTLFACRISRANRQLDRAGTA